MRLDEQWVVTYRFETVRGVTITEFYRGSFDECARICEHSADGEHDQHPTKQWQVAVGTVSAWEEFLRNTSNEPGVEALYVEAC